MRLEPLLEAAGNRPQLRVDLARRAPEDEVADGVTSNLGVAERTKEMDLAVGQHDSGTGGIFNGVFGLACLSSDAANCAG